MRYYIAKCLEQRADRASASRRRRHHTLSLAFCYQLGFDIQQDMVKYSQLLLDLDDSSIEDLKHMVRQAENGEIYWNFQNIIFRKSFEQNHFNAFDLVSDIKKSNVCARLNHRSKKKWK